jgi:hypothetical protein
MDRVIANIPAGRDIHVTNANPVDIHLNVAVMAMANKVCPEGFIVIEKFEDAPATLDGLVAFANREGRLGIAAEDSDGTIYDDAEVNIHLRAWHDSCHYRYLLAFNVAGEAAATYLMIAQLYRVYGVSPRTLRWAELILADILGLVLHFQRSRKYPKNKRAGTLNEAKRWSVIAKEIAEKCTGPEHEALALQLSRATWGNYDG